MTPLGSERLIAAAREASAPLAQIMRTQLSVRELDVLDRACARLERLDDAMAEPDHDSPH
ncbi:MAG: hypothetical protein R3F18_00880 [Lysobacterales bacterium]